MKKIAAFLTLICLLIPTGMSAKELYAGLIEFSSENYIVNSGFIPETEIKYSYERSAKWIQSKSGHREMKVGVGDWTPYDALHLMFYAEEANSTQYNIIVYCGDSAFRGGYASYVIDIDFSGWRDIEIPLEAFTPVEKKGVFDFGSVKGIAVNDFYSITPVVGSVACLDKIWLSGDDGIIEVKNEYPLSPSVPITSIDTEDMHTVAEFSCDDNIGSFGKTTDIFRMYEMSCIWDAGVPNTDVRINFSRPLDITKYNYLNFWIYSKNATDAVMIIAIQNTRYLATAYKINFTGWRLVSLPISGFELSNDPDKTAMTTLVFENNGWTGTSVPDTILCFDRVWFSKKAPSSFEPADSGENKKISRKDGQIQIKFTNNLYPSDYKKAVSVSSGGEDVDFDVTVKNNALKIDLKEELEAGQKIDVEILPYIYDISGQLFENEQKYGYTVSDSELSAGRIKIENNKSTVNVTNYSNEKKAVKLVFAGNKVDVEEYTLEGGESADITVESEESEKAVSYLAADDILSPLGEIACFGYEETELTESADITLTDVNMSGNTLEISGTANGDGTVLSAVSGEGYKFIRPEVIGKTFELSYDMSEYESGEYVFFLENVSKPFYYADAADAEALTAAVNNSESLDKMKTSIAEYEKIFLGTELNDNVYNSVFEGKPYESADDIKLVAKKATALLNEVNGSDWSCIENIFGENEKIIMNNSESYTKFLSLSASERAEVIKKLKNKGEYSSFVDIRNELKRILDSRTNNNSGSSSGGGSGGSSGGGKKSAVAEAPVSIIKNIEKPTVFSDLEEEPWAKEYIMNLYEKGIVNGDNGRFYPGADVTRAEFIKMLVAAFKIETGTDCTFDDVNENDWYYPYISAAQRSGIIRGDGEKAYPENNISREDAAVMLYRTAQDILSGDSADFRDSADISEYAAEAVAALNQNGILNGDNFGFFNPKKNLSRAEAAKIISSLIAKREV